MDKTVVQKKVDKTGPPLSNIPVKVEYDFTEANFDCIMTDTWTSLCESVAGIFEFDFYHKDQRKVFWCKAR